MTKPNLTPQAYTPAKRVKLYNPAEHNPVQATRPGSQDALELPSRVGEQLIYRDGRSAPLHLSETTT